MSEPFGAAFWNERYSGADRLWSGQPNEGLVCDVADLPPGRALDAGCGEGADAIWLATRGWQVTAVDLSAVALQRGREHADKSDVATRIDWQQRDLLADAAGLNEFDLVTAQFMQLPEEPRQRLFTMLADRVRGGGLLLIVGHDPSDLELDVARPPMPELFYSAAELAASLEPRDWEIQAAQARGRDGTDRHGKTVTVHDAVLRARRIRVRGGLPVRYRSVDEDSGRWDGFPFRDGDVVISTRSKSGTTWLQMICALLVFQTPELPESLTRLSPWLDMLLTPLDRVMSRLEAQPHRRFVKTHTPLDGVPVDPRASYLVAARHPLDMAVSLYHQGDNLDRKKMREVIGLPEPTDPAPPRRELHDWLVSWIDDDASHLDSMDSLPGVMWHLSDAWARREQQNVRLVRYSDLGHNLDDEMRAIAQWLHIDVPESLWPQLVAAASFDSMRSNADRLTPNPSGVMKSTAAFFRRGSSGNGAEVLTDDELAHYHVRVAAMAPADMLDWLHG